MADLEVLGINTKLPSFLRFSSRVEEVEKSLLFMGSGRNHAFFPVLSSFSHNGSSLCVVNNADTSQNNEKHVDHGCF